MGWVDNLPLEIVGVHDKHVVDYGDGKGWVLVAHAIGHDPDDRSSFSLLDWEEHGFGTICRVQHGWGSAGTIPLPEDDDYFLQRFENFVYESSGCHIWVFGNEMNHSQERPEGEEILPDRYADLYARAHVMLHQIPGHETDWLVLGAVAPWNSETKYPGNPDGDWIWYFSDILERLLDLGCQPDAVALHTYTHGSNPAMITESFYMDAPFDFREYNFLAYQDFMKVLGLMHLHIPVLITETDQNKEWDDVRNRWVAAAYESIADWNKTHEQQIYCLLLYCWEHRPGDFDYSIEHKPNILMDYTEAATKGYKRTEGEEPPGGNEMWNEMHVNRCEGGFFAQDGIGHLMMAKGLRVHWRHQGTGGFYPRPEMKPKEKLLGQPEVYEGLYSQSGFYISAEGQFAIVTDKIFVEPGKPVRGSAMYMHVYDDVAFGLGSRCGIVDGDGPFLRGPEWPKDGENPFEDVAIHWSDDWGSAWEGDPENLPQNIWKQLDSPEMVPSGNYVRLVVQFNADVKSAGSNGHWDLFRLEQYTDVTDPPIPPDPPVPPTAGGIQNYIDIAKINLDKLQVYVNTDAVLALLV